MTDPIDPPRPLVYVDALRPCVPNRQWRWRKSCHMFVDVGDLDLLHAFALQIGLRRAWFQDHTALPHYDLTAGRRVQAVRQGAVEVDRRFLVSVLRRWRAYKQENTG